MLDKISPKIESTSSKEKRDQWFYKIARAPHEKLFNTQQHKKHKINIDSYHNLSPVEKIKKR